MSACYLPLLSIVNRAARFASADPFQSTEIVAHQDHSVNHFPKCILDQYSILHSTEFSHMFHQLLAWSQRWSFPFDGIIRATASLFSFVCMQNWFSVCDLGTVGSGAVLSPLYTMLIRCHTHRVKLSTSFWIFILVIHYTTWLYNALWINENLKCKESLVA